MSRSDIMGRGERKKKRLKPLHIKIPRATLAHHLAPA